MVVLGGGGQFRVSEVPLYGLSRTGRDVAEMKLALLEN